MITDEMVWMATLSYIDSLQNAEFWRLDLSKPEAMRAALEAVLPMIRADVLEEAAKVADARELRWSEDAEQSNSGTAAHIFRRKADAAEQIAAAIRALKGTSHE
jgi:hypothetical protein